MARNTEALWTRLRNICTVRFVRRQTVGVLVQGFEWRTRSNNPLVSYSENRIYKSTGKPKLTNNKPIRNTQTWKQQQRLAAHQLTVTQMKFSPNNRQLLSVSRDRKWALFERNSSATTPAEPFDEFILIASTDKQNGVHGRIIWTCDWSHDSTLFATGSRDGKCAIWKHGNNNDGSLGEYFCAGVLEIKQSITAISFAKSYLKRATANYLVAVGCESGIISVCSFVENKWEQLRTLDASSAHHLSVRKLEFRPNVDGNECEANDSQDRHVLASCGNDNYVRIHELTF